MTSARSGRKGNVTALLMVTASLIALSAGMNRATAEDCTAHAAPPADLATPSMLYETLRTRTNAQLLAIGFLRKPVEQECQWIYEVKVLTASGSVVELDFTAAGLDLVGARGPDDDDETANLVKGRGGDASVLSDNDKRASSNSSSSTASNSSKGSGSGSGGGSSGGSGGSSSSGSGSGGSGSGGSGSGEGGSDGSGSGSHGGGDDGGGDDGGGGGDGGGGESGGGGG